MNARTIQRATLIMLQNFVRVLVLATLLTVFILLAHRETAHANVVGSDAQNFNPITSGLDFVTVQSSETLEPGVVNLGLFLNYAVNSLPYLDNSNGSRTNFADRLTSLDLNAGMGITENWDFGISFPHVINQQVDDGTTSRGEFASTGMTEIRANTKYRFLGDDTGGVAAVVSAGVNMIQDNPFAGRNSGPTTNLELAADTTINRWAVGGNFGYRIRSKGQKIPGSVANPLGNQWIASAAASYLIPSYSLKIITEVFGGFPAETSNSFGERTQTSLEWLIGLKHDINTHLAAHFGGGTEIFQGFASPDWRLYAGLNYTFGPLYQSSSPTPETRYLKTLPRNPNAPKTIERFRTQAILFEFDSDKMVGNNDAVLKELADTLSRGFKSLVVEGHTDSVGAESYNLALSIKRASAIRRRLVEKFGLPADRVKAEGFGESRPIADNGNYQGRQANRRVEFEVNFE